MSHKGLATGSVVCHVKSLHEYLNDARYQKIKIRNEQEYLSIQGNLESYYSLQILLTEINQLYSRQQNQSINVKVTIGPEQSPFEKSFARSHHI